VARGHAARLRIELRGTICGIRVALPAMGVKIMSPSWRYSVRRKPLRPSIHHDLNVGVRVGVGGFAYDAARDDSTWCQSAHCDTFSD
jgi:hypothetical protein